MSDLRFALRTLAKSPGFAAIAIFTLALAIGVNSAVFSLINGVVLRPLAPLRPAELVSVFHPKQGANRDYRQFSHAEFAALRADRDVLADTAALTFVLTGIGRDEGMRRSFAFIVSENFFSMMGVTPAAGRFFTAEESRPNANLPVLVASYGLWQRLGARSDFVGSQLHINGQAYTVVGITPRGFSGLNALISPEVWLPFGTFAHIASSASDAKDVVDLASPRNYTLNVVARLAPGLTIESAQPRLAALASRLATAAPSESAAPRELVLTPPSRLSLSTVPEQDDTGVISVALLGLAGCVLLVASLNLANMLLARGTARAREIALRLALGASRWRVVRQLLAEGLLLALAGGAGGLLFAFWCNDLLLQSLMTIFSSMNFSLAMDARPDLVVLDVTFLFCLLATLLFSLGPALKTSRVDLVHDLKQQAGEPTVAGSFNRFFALRHCLVMAQIALSLMLLFSAGLFIRGALNASGLKPGFDAAGRLTGEIDFSLANTPEAVARPRMFATLDRVRSLPGVTDAALATLLPYNNAVSAAGVQPATDAPATPTDEHAPAAGASGFFSAVSPHYFNTMGIPLLQGRDFRDSEASDRHSPRVVILDETLAKKLFPKGDALGQRIRYLQPPADGSPAEMEIVGIVAAHRQRVFDGGPTGWIYVPLAHSYSAAVFLQVRLATTDAASTSAFIAPLRRALREFDASLPLLQIMPYANLLDRNVQLWIVRIGAAFFGVFGLIALLLAAVGVYGVKAYAVARRTREIGIRLAIGARPADVFALIMKQGALQTGVAVALGLLLALALGRVLAQILFRVNPADPLTLAAAALLLTTAALLACYLPARRATKVSPITALRSE